MIVGVGVRVGVAVIVGVLVRVGVRVDFGVCVAMGTGVLVEVGTDEGVLVAVAGGSMSYRLSDSLERRPLHPARTSEIATSRKETNLLKRIDKNSKIPLV